jgi:hypothetical protein
MGGAMSLRDESYYKIESSDLAEWLERQGTDRWWNVDGDPLLTDRVSFPCPSDELAAELRRINRLLLVQDRRKSPLGHGEKIASSDLDELVTRLGDNIQTNHEEPAWASDRLLFLCWEACGDEWLLVEDEETARRSREDAASLPDARK